MPDGRYRERRNGTSPGANVETCGSGHRTGPAANCFGAREGKCIRSQPSQGELMRIPWLRSSWISSSAVAALILVSSLLLPCHGHAQMASSGAKDQPARPLPRGMKAPSANFQDVAARAGLTAVIVSGDLDQTAVIENTGTGVAIFDYDNDGLPDIFFLCKGTV